MSIDEICVNLMMSLDKSLDHNACITLSWKNLFAKVYYSYKWPVKDS